MADGGDGTESSSVVSLADARLVAELRRQAGAPSPETDPTVAATLAELVALIGRVLAIVERHDSELLAARARIAQLEARGRADA